MDKSEIKSITSSREINIDGWISHRLWMLLAYILFVIAFILIGTTFLDYGITYDEDWHANYGEYIVQWYRSGFRDDRALTYWTLPLQAGLFSTVSSLATRISPIGDFETSHLINALFGFIGMLGAYKVGKLLSGPFVGFLAALFLLLTPRFYGHAFNNRVDIPMATLTIWTIYYILVWVRSLPAVSKGTVIKLGVVIGLALGVRAGAVILIGYLGIASGLWLTGYYWLKIRSRSIKLKFDSPLIRVSIAFIVVCVIAYVVMLVWWPAAQVQPIKQPAKGLLYATEFGYAIEVLFDGQSILNNELPWYYLPKWFLITLPEYYFIAMIIGLVTGVYVFMRADWSINRLLENRNLPFLLLPIYVFLPLIFTVLTSPPDYDGIRHFLFILPPLAVLAAVSIDWLVRHSRFLSPFPGVIVLMAIIVSLALTALDMIQLHPHQYVYFNRLFGKGLVGAAGSFDTDYWGNSYKEGVEWLASNYIDENLQRRPKIASCAYSLSTSYYLPEDRFEYVGSFHDGQYIAEDVVPDLFLATTRWNCHQKLAGSVLHTVTRQGVPLLYVIEVSPEAAIAGS